MSRTKRKPAAQIRKPKAKGQVIAAEIVGVLLLFAAAFLVLSLISYDPKDPSLFSSVSPKPKVHNYGGQAGAGLADLLLQVFGLAAFLLPFMAGYLGLRSVMSGEKKHLLRKTGQYVLLLLILCPLLHLFFQNISWRGDLILVGGLLGDMINSFLHSILNSTGTLIFLLAAASLFIVLSSAFSFKKLFLALGRMFSFAFKEVRIKIFDRRKAKAKDAAPDKPSSKKAGKTDVAVFEEEETAPGAAGLKEGRFLNRSEPGKGKIRNLKTSSIKPPEIKHPRPDEEPLLFPVSEDYDFPPINLLDPGKPSEKIDKNELLEKKRLIEEKLREFKVEGEVKEYHPGPVITTYEFYPNPGVKISQVAGLAEDLSLALRAESVRIQRIPGKSSLGVEIPNNKREIIKLRDIIESDNFAQSTSKLTFALGKTVHDEVYVTDLGIMPHLLIAGATGTGKSVCLNALIASIMYKASPDEVKLILIDPKRLEFTLYDGIPHLLSPIVNDPKKAGIILMDAVKRMEQRYHLLSQHKVRNIEQFNHHIAQILKEKKGKLTDEEKKELRPLPYIVIIIDELAELMMVGAQDVDYAIARLAQLARAVGIHLVLATQRPSIDVITGTIKNNFSSRIAFRVPSKIDSRVILDTGGADKLLGMGDMLFMPPNYPRLQRLHCAYVSIPEIRRLVKFVKEQRTPDYDERLVSVIKNTGPQDWDDLGEKDELYENAVRLILHTGQASASYLQRKLKLGYARASRIIDQMEQEGILGPSEGSKPREIMIDVKQWMEQSKKKVRED
ncbi:MAG: DNA translocase FtsK [Candidatus Aminicenantales bacterium]